MHKTKTKYELAKLAEQDKAMVGLVPEVLMLPLEDPRMRPPVRPQVSMAFRGAGVGDAFKGAGARGPIVGDHKIAEPKVG